MREFDKRSKHFLLGDNFINSKNLLSWPCIRGYCESEDYWCWSLLGLKGLKQVKRNNLFFASLICSYVWPFLCLKMWIIVSNFLKIHYLKEFLWMSCIFHFIPLLLPVLSFKTLICNTVDFFWYDINIRKNIEQTISSSFWL